MSFDHLAHVPPGQLGVRQLPLDDEMDVGEVHGGGPGPEHLGQRLEVRRPGARGEGDEAGDGGEPHEDVLVARVNILQHYKISWISVKT